MRAWLLAMMFLLAGCMDLSHDGEGDARDDGPGRDDRQGSASGIPCIEHPFTVSPVAADHLLAITPLGNMHPPDHTLPTVHMYLSPDGRTQVRAPGDIIIDSVQTTRYLERGTEDHGIRFSVCDDVHGYFLHIKSLDPDLEARIGEACDNEGSGGGYAYCDRSARIEVTAGTVLGEVEPNNFDLGLRDRRVTLPFANPDRYTGDWVHTVCPIDYFAPDVQELLRERLDHPDRSCGEVMQDVPGTIAGAWFHGDATAEAPEDWSHHLTFAADNQNPDRRVISVGGVFMDAARWSFVPQDNGTTNRDFVDVVPDGTVHCYMAEPDPRFGVGATAPEGRIVVQMVEAERLVIEYQDGSCDDDSTLTSPTEYQR